MPSYACTVCGKVTDKRRCPDHPEQRGPSSYVTGRRDWRKLKAAVIKRDRHICWLCGQPGADSADHVTPVSKGGTNSMTNLKAAHSFCNQQRGARG